jgi:hypothetical protein
MQIQPTPKAARQIFDVMNDRYVLHSRPLPGKQFRLFLAQAV